MHVLYYLLGLKDICACFVLLARSQGYMCMTVAYT